MNRKILFVDDEKNILDTFRRNLGRRFEIETALGPLRALDMIDLAGPFAVIVSDLRMPEMEGVAFLAKVREKSPDTARVMLTGFADLGVAMAAVNEGHVFRFLTKPCPADVLVRSLEAGIEQYRLVTAEKELLRGTLKGSVKVLTEMLSLVNPEAFGKSERIKRLVSRAAQALRLPGGWRLELAAMLSRIGFVAVPEDILDKVASGRPPSPEEAQILAMGADVTVRLLTNIPRLEEVVEIIKAAGNPHLLADFPIPARLLRLAEAFDDAMERGQSKDDAMRAMQDREVEFGADLLSAFERSVFGDEGYAPRRLALAELRPGMILDAALTAPDGTLYMAKGRELGEVVLEKLRLLARARGVKEPIDVLAPLEG